jgi:hypothetical protein
VGIIPHNWIFVKGLYKPLFLWYNIKNYMSMSKTITYMLTNMVTGEEYVGVTTNELRVRCYHHKCRAKQGNHNHLPLYQNINQYGWDNFRSQVLCEGNDEEYYCWLMQPTLNQCWVGKKPISEIQVKACKESNSKKILCVETGVVYDSARDAGRALGKPKLFKGISNVLRGKVETAGGYHWEYHN